MTSLAFTVQPLPPDQRTLPEHTAKWAWSPLLAECPACGKYYTATYRLDLDSWRCTGCGATGGISVRNL